MTIILIKNGWNPLRNVERDEYGEFVDIDTFLKKVITKMNRY
jgi:hypothetical protein